MEASGQGHDPAALSLRKVYPEPIERENVWVPEPAFKLWKWRQVLCPSRKLNHGYSVVKPIA